MELVFQVGGDSNETNYNNNKIITDYDSTG